MLPQLLGQFLVMILLISLIGWISGTFVFGMKISPLWLFGRLGKGLIRLMRGISRGISRYLYAIRSYTLKSRPNNMIGQTPYLIVAAFVGIAGLIASIPAVLLSNAPRSRR